MIRQNKRLKTGLIAAAAAIVLIAGYLILNATVLEPNSRYKKGLKLMEEGDYNKAISVFAALDGYKDSEDLIVRCQHGLMYQEADALMEAGRYAAAGMLLSRAGDYEDAQEKAQTCWAKGGVRASIAAGAYHTVGLKTDGTVVATGGNDSGQCDVSGWRDIVAVTAGASHTVGLKADGTVVATGSNESGQCDVAEWKDVVAVAAGFNCTLGLKKDGTVVAAGTAGDVSDWEDIVAVAAGFYRTVGLKADGTVVATSGDVSDWEDIVAVAAGWGPVVGLKSDGTPVAAIEEINFDGWTDITAVASYAYGIVGLKKDGTVVSTAVPTEESALSTELSALSGTLALLASHPDIYQWTDVAAVACGANHIVGLKKDGTVLCSANSLLDVGDVSGWKDISCGCAAE